LFFVIYPALQTRTRNGTPSLLILFYGSPAHIYDK